MILPNFRRIKGLFFVLCKFSEPAARRPVWALEALWEFSAGLTGRKPRSQPRGGFYRYRPVYSQSTRKPERKSRSFSALRRLSPPGAAPLRFGSGSLLCEKISRSLALVLAWIDHSMRIWYSQFPNGSFTHNIRYILGKGWRENG